MTFSQGGDAPGSLRLPAVLSLTEAKDLRDGLIASLAADEVSIEAADVERLSTPCAQVLLAAGQTAEAAGKPFRILNSSAAFSDALAEFGLQSRFAKWVI